MNNKDLERTKNNAKKELGDYQSTAENIIDELVDEIEILEYDNEKLQSEVDDAKKTIEEFNEEIKDLNEQLKDAQQAK